MEGCGRAFVVSRIGNGGSSEGREAVSSATPDWREGPIPGRGKVLAVKYGKDIADQWSVKELFELANNFNLYHERRL